MKPRSRILTAMAALLLLTAIAGVAYLLVAEPWAQRLRLPDGSTLTLWSVTFGKQHEFDDRQGWRRLLPAAWAGGANVNAEVKIPRAPK